MAVGAVGEAEESTPPVTVVAGRAFLVVIVKICAYAMFAPVPSVVVTTSPPLCDGPPMMTFPEPGSLRESRK